MSSPPTVSVVVPTYNRAHLLPQTLASALGQSFEDFEIVVVDDGSTDGTAALVRGLRDPRVVYCPIERTGNLSKVRNVGLRRARGRYLGFLDSDDLWEPEKLRRQVDVMERHDHVGFVMCGYEMFNADGVFFTNRYESYLTEPEATTIVRAFEPLLRLQMPIVSSSPLFRRRALEAGLLHEDLRAGDHDFFVRVAFDWPVAIVPIVLLRIRRHEGGVARQWGAEGFEGVMRTADHFFSRRAISPQMYREVLSLCSGGLFKLVRQSRDVRTMCRNLAGSARLQPRLFRAWGRYAVECLVQKR